MYINLLPPETKCKSIYSRNIKTRKEEGNKDTCILHKTLCDRSGCWSDRCVHFVKIHKWYTYDFCTWYDEKLKKITSHPPMQPRDNFGKWDVSRIGLPRKLVKGSRLGGRGLLPSPFLPQFFLPGPGRDAWRCSSRLLSMWRRATCKRWLSEPKECAWSLVAFNFSPLEFSLFLV